MKTSHRWIRKRLRPSLIAVACFALLGAGREDSDDKPIPLTVPKAVCGPHDNPETALQGQVPAAMRAVGFKGLQLQPGAAWTEQRRRRELADDAVQANARGMTVTMMTTMATAMASAATSTRASAAYHGTASPARSLPGRAHLGVPVLDLSDPRKSDADGVSHHDVDARSVGVPQGERAAATPWSRQRPERRRRAGDRHL